MRRLMLLWLLLVPPSAAAQTVGTGAVAGRTISSDGNVLPGVTITLSGNGTTATVVTDADGHFRADAFSGGSAPVTLSASLAGFQTTTRRGIRIRPGGTVNVGDIRLPIGCLSIVDFVATGLREEASRAQSVTHLRIESAQPAREWTMEKHCYTGSEVSAVVMNDSTGRRPGTRIRFVPIASPTMPPYAPGDQIVVALDQDHTSGQYFSWGYGYRVSNGVVALDAPFDEFEEGIPVGLLFERLKDGR